MTKAIPQLQTVGKISADLNQPIHRIEYILATRAHILPAALAGRLRLFSATAMAQIRHELNAIDARQSQKAGGQPDD